MKKAKIKYFVKRDTERVVYENEGTILGVTTVKDQACIIFVTVGLGLVLNIPIRDIIVCRIKD